MKNKTVFHDFSKPPELGKWFAVLVLVKNSVLYNSNEFNGLTLCKIRQIKKLGYVPILVSVLFNHHSEILMKNLFNNYFSDYH